MMLRRLIALAAGAALFWGSDAMAANHICWIDRVVPDAGGALRVVLDTPYRFALRRVVRAGGAEELLPHDKPPASFALREGDTAYLLGTPHDSCVLTVQRRDGVLGLWAQAVTRVHNLPPTEASEFIVPQA